MQHKKSYLNYAAKALVLSTLGALTLPALAQGSAVASEIVAPLSVEQRVQQLLQRGVEHIKQKGVVGVNDFNRDARFVDKDLYLFSLNTDGVLLSSGGWSASLIGENVLDIHDEQGRPFFAHIVKGATTQQQGEVEYQWYNPTRGGMDEKVTFYQLVNGVIVAVGYFPTVATAEQIQLLLDKAIFEYQEDPQVTLRKFANEQSEFQQLGLKFVVLDPQTQTVVFDAENRYLSGVELVNVLDVTGHPFLLEAVKTATDTMQQIDVSLLNLKTKRVDVNKLFFKRGADNVIGVLTEAMLMLQK